MKNLLKRLFSGKRLVDHAKHSSNEIFVLELLRTQLYLVGIAAQPGLPHEGVTEELLLNYIRNHSRFDDADFSPMTLEYNGVESLLVFSTEENRELFTSMFSNEASRTFVFQTASIDGDRIPDLARQISGIILNAGSDESHILTPEQLELLRSHAKAPSE